MDEVRLIVFAWKNEPWKVDDDTCVACVEVSFLCFPCKTPLLLLPIFFQSRCLF